jgi:hypothetical protein
VAGQRLRHVRQPHRAGPPTPRDDRAVLTELNHALRSRKVRAGQAGRAVWMCSGSMTSDDLWGWLGEPVGEEPCVIAGLLAQAARHAAATMPCVVGPERGCVLRRCVRARHPGRGGCRLAERAEETRRPVQRRPRPAGRRARPGRSIYGVITHIVVNYENLAELNRLFTAWVEAEPAGHHRPGPVVVPEERARRDAGVHHPRPRRRARPCARRAARRRGRVHHRPPPRRCGWR